MQRTIRRLIDLMIVVISFFCVTPALAAPTTALQAQQVVINWLSLDRAPLGTQLGQFVKEIRTYSDSSCQSLYYIVYLNPSGFVVVPADDLVEPIIAFQPEGTYDPSPKNPLGALVSQDVPGRLAQLRGQEAQARAADRKFTPVGATSDAQRKWNRLRQGSFIPQTKASGLVNLSDVRVAPLVQSAWDQGAIYGGACYNYYTPPYAAGSTNNYVCGCVATAMAQLMRYYQKPAAGVGTASFQIWVAGESRTEKLRGGDGNGGGYNWNKMPLVPDASLTDAQRQAIGALTHDAGVAVNMSYWPETLGSGTDLLKSADALKNTFGYSNAKKGYNNNLNLPQSNFSNMVNPNLEASCPVLLGVALATPTGYTKGHAIVCDGYGYNTGTIYHHLNMGWVDNNAVGSDNVWYNLPNINSKLETYNLLLDCVYNIFVSGSGEIVSGRVYDTNATTPLSGVTITATGPGGPYNAATNDKGIYALGNLPSGNSFTITASKAGYTFNTQNVSTGTSTDNTTITGNLWGINFTAGGAPLSLNQAVNNTTLAFSTGGDAAWFGESVTKYDDQGAAESGAITTNQSSWMETTVVGPGILSFYWKVSSMPAEDFLELYLDGLLQPDPISGEVDWVQRTLGVPAGSHIVKWQFTKGTLGSAGSDCGWVDEVVFSHKGSFGIYNLLLLD
jgi:hypothetical protein